MSMFKKATKAAATLRMALIAPSGGGKSFTALQLACALSKRRVAAIDTERGSLSRYAHLWDFDVAELERHSPDDYRHAIDECIAAGIYDALVIDSLSHAWMGKGGALEQVDLAAARSKTGNSFAAWRDVTPMHNKLVDALVACPMHLLVTMRAKTEWVQEKDERGKTQIRKVGLAAVQRDGLEYEFDVVGDMEPDRNTLVITKTRCPDLQGSVIEKPGPELAETLRGWLAGTESPFGRAVNAIMLAKTGADLAAASELAKHLGESDRARIRPIYKARADRIQQAAQQQQAAASAPLAEQHEQPPEQGEVAEDVDPDHVADVDPPDAAGDEAPPQEPEAPAPEGALPTGKPAAAEPVSPHLPGWATPPHLQGKVATVEIGDRKVAVYLATEVSCSPPVGAAIGDVIYRSLPATAHTPQLLRWDGQQWVASREADDMEAVRAAFGANCKARATALKLNAAELLDLARERITEQRVSDLKNLTTRSLLQLRAALAELQKGAPKK